MTQEIVEAVRELERDKGIESGTLVAALEDALLAAYKKTPGASRHATVELDDAGDFRVFAIELPEDLETRLLDDAREKALDELERIEEETGEKNHTLLTDDDLDVDWSQVPEDQITARTLPRTTSAGSPRRPQTGHLPPMKVVSIVSGALTVNIWLFVASLSSRAAYVLP